MQKTLAAFLFLLAGILPTLAACDLSLLQGGWKFIREDAGIAAASDSWEKISLPHTWNAKDSQVGREGGKSVSDTCSWKLTPGA